MTGDGGDVRRDGSPADELLADFVLGLLDEAEASSVAAAGAADPSVARRIAAMRHALDALAIDLEPASPPPGGLERLLGEARSTNDDTAEGVPPPRRTKPMASASSAPPRHPRRASAWVAATLVVALVALAGAFATLQAGAVAKVREEQRVLAYWMGNPGMTLVSLEAPPGTDDGAWEGGGGGDGGGGGGSDVGGGGGGDVGGAVGGDGGGGGAVAADPTGRLGVVCLLPDGRGLVLRPSPAPDGAWYQVVGTGPEGDVELARGAGNLLTFDATGVERVEVRVLDARRGGVGGVLDRAVQLLGGRPTVRPGGIGDGTLVAQARLP